MNGTWSGSNPNAAVFGAGSPGSYVVTLSSTVEATNLSINTSGYTLAGSSLILTAAGGTPGISLAAGLTNGITCPLVNSNGWDYSLAANSALFLGGGQALGGGNPRYLGSSPVTDAINLTNGTYGMSGTWGINGVTLNLTGANTVAAGSSRVDIGRITASVVNVGAGAQFNQNVGSPNDNNSNLQISRGQPGTLNVLAGGLVSTYNNGSYAGGSLLVLPDSSSQATLNVQSGATVNVGIGSGGTPGLARNGLAPLVLLGGNNSTAGLTFSASAQGIVNVYGGVITARGIQFGSSGGIYTQNPAAQFNLVGGMVYLGANGISTGSGVTGFVSPQVNLSGGTLAAVANWTSVLPISLPTNGSSVTFQAADAGGAAWNIALLGALSGKGGLLKTGAGTLSLSGTNTYLGPTAVNAGTLATTTASTGGGSCVVAAGAGLAIQAASLGSSFSVPSLALSNNTTVTLDPNTFGSLAAPLINVAGALVTGSSVTVNFNAGTLPYGQYHLIKYGSLGGAGFAGFVLGAVTVPAGSGSSATLVNNLANQSLDISIASAAGTPLKWDGAVNGNWDINATPNWQTNTLYTQTNGAGPVVTFDDTAAGPYTAIVLTANVSPAAVIFSNSVLNYSISGPGGITGPEGLLKTGSGAVSLAGTNAYTGGTTVNAGTLIVNAGENGATAYTINGGQLAVTLAARNQSLPMSSLAFGSNAPALGFNMGNQGNVGAPVISVAGNLSLNGNVVVNVTNTPATASEVLLQYNGARSGPGSFIAGALPPGAMLVDNLTNQQVLLAYHPGLRTVVPVWNTNEIVVALTTPQDFGAVGDGVTDDTLAFQNAMNAVYNSGGPGGGVVYVPPANYAFYTNLVIPTGVTLHGDWTDWTLGTNGLVGTTFCVYAGAGQTNGAPFISLNRSAAVRDINIWYPNQNPAGIVPYPYALGVGGGDNFIQNLVLVNSYAGIQVSSAEFVLSTVIGTPLYMGVTSSGVIADICQTEDIRFSPAIWPASRLPGAPAPGSAYATWMRTNGTGIQMYRIDGLINVNTEISGYNVGLDFETSSNGQAGCSFFNGWVTNCATALLAQEMQTAEGLEISDFLLDGDVAVSRTHLTNSAAAEFDNCQIIGRAGPAVSCTGANWQSSMAFQNCTISNAVTLAGPGVLNFVNCRLLGATQCVMSATGTRIGFTGCTFAPAQKIVNNGSANNLLLDPRPAISNAMPVFDWTNVMADFATRRPAKTNLFVTSAFGTTGNGNTDDTLAIRNALAAAGANGGGIVYLPPGQYHVTNTLDVPPGVELRGPYEARHGTWPGADGVAKGAIVQPYGGQGNTNGPVAIALEPNAGLVGVTLSYENQGTNCYPYPPAIQGRGGNIYAIGVQCPNPYIFLDLDTYTCTNHFIDMLDGWALLNGARIGNGSSGTFIDCHANWTFWIDNYGSRSSLPVAAQPPVDLFVMNNLQYYVLGNCQELFVKDFSIIENMYMHCISENGIGPVVTGISAMCDATYQCFVFDSAGPCTFNDVNPEWLVSLNGGYANLTNQAAILTTSNFVGTVRFFNSPIWGSHTFDYIINGGDVGLELVHLWQYAYQGARVNGGTFHLVNCGAFNVVDGGAGYPAYNLLLGAGAGAGGLTNDAIGCFSYGGWNIQNNAVTNPVNIWMDYALGSYNVLNEGPVAIGNVYPTGNYQFQPAPALTFQAYSPNGINTNGITVSVVVTNLLGQGYVSNFTSAVGLAVSGSDTAKFVGLPLATNALYNVSIQVADRLGNRATNVVAFDTVNPVITFDAEDFDYGGGNFIGTGVANAYAGLVGTAGIDYSNSIVGQGSASYRPQGLETEGAGDKPRLAYAGAADYDVGFASRNNWGNYTRAVPPGTFYVFMRAASPNGPTSDSCDFSLVTSGAGTANQTVAKLGNFSVPNTGSWQTYAWVPALAAGGSPVTVTGGSVETMRATTANGGYNVNYYLLAGTNLPAPWVVSPAAPAGLTATPDNQQISLAWAAVSAATAYTVLRSGVNGGPYTAISSNLSAITFSDVGLTNGVTYYYVVQSQNPLGNGGYSAQVSATPSAPPVLGASWTAGSGLLLSWPTNGAGSAVTVYTTTNLSSGIWVPVTNALVLSNAQWNVWVPATSGNSGFYRLQP